MTGSKGASTRQTDVAYKYALAHLVYPTLDEAAPWFQPLMLRFDVNRDEVLGLTAWLAKKWESGHAVSFYYLEQQCRYYPWAVRLDRSGLIYACRYIFLHNLFDKAFWSMLCERGNSPCEAELITL